MDSFHSNEVFTVACPACQKEIQKPLSWFNKDIVSCPHCKALVHTRKFRPELEAAERNASKHRKQF